MQESSSNESLMIDPDKMTMLDLPDETKVYLTSRSLKSNYPLQVSFAVESGAFPTLNAFCSAHNLTISVDGNNLYRFGTDEGSQLCLTVGKGEVVAVDPTGRHKQRFVNTSIECFIALLELYAMYASAVQNMPEDQAASMVEQTAIKMSEKDSAAFYDPDNWKSKRGRS